MKAAVCYDANIPLVIEKISTRKPKPREVPIGAAVSGLWHSDLHFIEGLYPHPLPMVIGHEVSRLAGAKSTKLHTGMTLSALAD